MNNAFPRSRGVILSCQLGRLRPEVLWKDLGMLVEILVLAISVAVLGGLAMLGTDSLPNPVSAVVCFVVLPLIASAGFVTLASLSGG
jgi:hypothetical protein